MSLVHTLRRTLLQGFHHLGEQNAWILHCFDALFVRGERQQIVDQRLALRLCQSKERRGHVLRLDVLEKHGLMNDVVEKADDRVDQTRLDIGGTFSDLPVELRRVDQRQGVIDQRKTLVE